PMARWCSRRRVRAGTCSPTTPIVGTASPRPPAGSSRRPSLVASRAVPAAARHLRLVHPGRRAASRTQTDLATRRTVAMLLGATAFLVAAGLIMVLSASSISAYAQFGDSFLFFQRQAGYAVAGTLGLWLTSRMRYQAWR